MAHYVIYNKKDNKFVGGVNGLNYNPFQVDHLFVMSKYNWFSKPITNSVLRKTEKDMNLPDGSLISHKFTDEELHDLRSMQLSGDAFKAVINFLKYATLDSDKLHIDSLANGIISQFKIRAGYDITKGEWLGNKKKD